jgi:hypothetical protein
VKTAGSAGNDSLASGASNGICAFFGPCACIGIACGLDDALAPFRGRYRRLIGPKGFQTTVNPVKEVHRVLVLCAVVANLSPGLFLF